MNYSIYLWLLIVPYAVYLIYEFIRTPKLSDNLEKQISEIIDGINEIQKNSKLKVKYNEIQAKYYAYSCFTKEELIYIQLSIKSQMSESRYINPFFEHTQRIALPLVIIFLSVLFSTSNNLLSIASKPGTQDTTEQSNIVNFISNLINTSGFIICIAVIIFVVSLINTISRSERHKKIQSHLLIIEEVLKCRNK